MNRTLGIVLVLLAAVLAAALAPGGTPASPEYRFVRLREEPSRPDDAEPTDAAQQLADVFARDGWTLEHVDSTWIATLNDEHTSTLLVFRREP